MSKPGLLNGLAWLLGGSVPRNRDELGRLMSMAFENSQIFSEGETRMLSNVMNLPHLRVEDAMIPQGKVDWLSSDDTYSEITRKIGETRHSRYPVLDAEDESVKGILHVKRLVGIKADDGERILETRDLTKPSRTVPEAKRLDAMLREFQYYRLHMAVVADESGKPSGMVTLEDVIERIVGEIHDEFDTMEVTRQHIRSTGKDGQWRVDGDTPLEKLNETLGLSLDTSRSETVGGWIANQLGKMPERGDSVDEGGLRLRVGRMDERKVLSVDIARTADEPAGPAKA